MISIKKYYDLFIEKDEISYNEFKDLVRSDSLCKVSTVGLVANSICNETDLFVCHIHDDIQGILEEKLHEGEIPDYHLYTREEILSEMNIDEKEIEDVIEDNFLYLDNEKYIDRVNVVRLKIEE